MKLETWQRTRLETMFADQNMAATIRTLAGALLTLNGDPTVASTRPYQSNERARYVVREIQRALSVGGYAPGPLDGLWGPHTEAALQRCLYDLRQRT